MKLYDKCNDDWSFEACELINVFCKQTTTRLTLRKRWKGGGLGRVDLKK